MSFSKDYHKTVIDKMSDAYAYHKIILDQAGNPCDYEFLDVNSSFEAFTGLEKEKIIGCKAGEIFTNIKEASEDWIKVFGEVALEGTTFSAETYSKSLRKWFKINTYSPQKYYFITILQDISEHKEKVIDYQKKLQNKIYYDPMTGLPNRSLLNKKMSENLHADQTNKHTIFFIDLDNIKYINDTLGHFAGDKLIIQTGNRLSSLLETGSHVFRFGGDEFVIVKTCSNLQETKEFSLRILQLFRKPFIIENTRLYTTVSMGISIFPDHSTDPDELLKYADIAMYQAKTNGKNKYVIFKREMQRSVNKRMLLEKHLHSALYNNELSLYYQPLIELKTGRIFGFEALLRWFNPQLGSVAPAEFIPVAEDTHLIISIGEWILRNGCYFLKKLHNLGHNDLTISINISITQLLEDNFIEQVLTILEFTQLRPEHLELELTESVFMESYEGILDKLQLLREKGVKIALDDFGKGYSSLRELNQLPITTLKIDKSFIDNIEFDRINKSIVSMIIKLGRIMGLTVHAEGVENQGQVDFLTRQKCHRLQGYFFSKPLQEKELLEILQGNNDNNNNYAKFVWKNDYNINIKEIDKQHRKIFEIGNRVSKLIFSNKSSLPYREIQQILNELKDYTIEHFSIEEEFMKQNHYVNYRSHKIMHTHFTESILNFENKNIELIDKNKLIELLDTIFVWITDHIIKVDNQMGKIITNAQGKTNILK